MQHPDEGTIHAWLDGALTAEEARQAEEHIAACAACSAAVAEARGLIAASSMILSKLDAAPAAVEPAVRRRPPVVRHWFAGSRLKAAAAVLILAGGAAAVNRVTSPGELARVTSDAAMESGLATAEPASAVQEVQRAVPDATAAEREVPVPAPAPLTVGPAPAAPPSDRPRPARGGVPSPRAEIAAVAAVADELAPVAAQANASEARAGNAGIERDMSASAKLAAPTGDVVVAGGTARAADARRFADSVQSALARQRQLRAREQAAAPQRLSPGSAPGPMPAAPAPAMGMAGGRAAAPSMAVAESRPDSAGAARCYVLALTPWTPERPAIPPAPSTRIILSADTGTDGPARGQRLVRPMPDAFPGSYDDAWWSEVSPSTVVITWATGTQGIVMRLVRSGEELAGTARTFGGAAGAEQASSVRAERIDCAGSR